VSLKNVALFRKEILMSMFPEIESGLNRKRIVAEMNAIRLEEEAVKGKTLLDKNLAQLGNLLVSAGEKLRRTYSSQEAGSVKLVKKAA
jgi:hypothetical protein